MDNEIRWSLGAQVETSDGTELIRTRWLTNGQAAELQKKFKVLEDLVGQREFHLLLQSAQAWQDLLARALEEGSEDGRISGAIQNGARREICVLARLFDEFLATAELTNDEMGADSDLAGALAALRDTDAYKQLTRLAKDSRDGRDVIEVAVNGDLVFADFHYAEAANLSVALVRFAGMAVPKVLLSRHSRFEEIAEEVDALASEVERGVPSLVGLEANHDAGESLKLKLQALPMHEIAVLRAVFGERDHQGMVSVLIRNRERRSYDFGSASADRAVRDGHASQGLDALPEATLELEHDLLGAAPIDFWAPVSFKVSQWDFERELFEGVVQDAESSEGKTALRCEGAAALTEHTTGGMLSARIAPGEVIRSIMAQAGWEGELVLSEEPNEQSEEELHVVVPVRGIQTEATAAFGAVELLPAEDGLKVFGGLEVDRDAAVFPALRDEYESGTSYLRRRVTSTTLHEAEDRGIESIETALAWIITRARYGTALMPDGTGNGFNRQVALNGPEQGSVVVVIGQDTGR